MLTPFGKVVRKLRIDKGERLKEMAESFEMSSAYLSAVETGKKAVSVELVASVVRHFGLSAKEERELVKAAQQSGTQVTVGLVGASSHHRAVAIAFARRFSALSEEEVNKIKLILERKVQEG